MSDNDANKLWEADGPMLSAIHRGSFIEALDEASRLAANELAGDVLTSLSAKIDDVRADCRMMFKSMVDGVVSDDLDALFSHMRQRLYLLADSLRLAMAAVKPDAPLRLKKMAEQDSCMADVVAIIADYRQEALLGSDGLGSIENLCQVLDCQSISEFEARALFNSVIKDVSLPRTHRAFALGAITHNLISRHNRALALELVKTLMDDDLEPAVIARTAVALAADMLAWPQRWTDDAELLAALDTLASPGGYASADIVRHAVVSVARQRLASVVEHIFEVEMQNEMNILVKKLINKKQKPGGGPINLSEDDAEEIFGIKGKKLLGNLAKIEEWKAKGVDVGFVSMKHMKLFPFFRKSIVNWLRPYDPADPLVADALSSLEPQMADYVANAMAAANMLPDSDKYSVLFGMKGMSADTVKEYCRVLSSGAQNADVKTGVGDVPAPWAADSFVKDLYRAAKLNSGQFGATGLFASQREFFSSGLYSHLFSVDQLPALGLSLVESRSWSEAQEVYSILCAKDGADVASLRKLAFCLLKQSDTEAALEQLRKADIVDDSDPWTKRMIAECYINLGKYPQAAYALESARQLSPSDLRLTRLSALCNESLRRFETALKDWRSVSYAQAEDAEAAIGIARCLLFMGRAAEAAEALGACPEGLETSKVRALLLVAQLKFTEARGVLASVAAVAGTNAAAEWLAQSADPLSQYGVTKNHILIIADSIRDGSGK